MVMGGVLELWNGGDGRLAMGMALAGPPALFSERTANVPEAFTTRSGGSRRRRSWITLYLLRHDLTKHTHNTLHAHDTATAKTTTDRQC